MEWRGKPVWIVRRTPEMLASLEKVESQLADPKSDRTAFPVPQYAKNRHRSIKPEVLVTVGICTHLGCSPVSKFETGNQPGLGADLTLSQIDHVIFHQASTIVIDALQRKLNIPNHKVLMVKF